METGIYEILNTVNGKWYRGQVIADYGFEGRFKQHRAILNRGACENKHLQGAWNKYGEGAFTFSILERCPPELCNEREEWWIGEDYQRSGISYNKQAGGSNGRCSEETRRQTSETMKRICQKPSVRKKRSDIMKKKWADPEERRKRSKALKIAHNRPEVKRKKSEAANRPEWILKQRQARGQAFICTWPDGRVKRYLSVHEAAADLGVGSGSTIHKYLKGPRAPGNHPNTAHLKGCVFTYCEQ